VNAGQLGDLLIEDLKRVIDAEFPAESIPDPLTRQARDHEAFAEVRRRTYVGRPEYFDKLDRHAAGGGQPLVLVGDSEVGKSALLANRISLWRESHPDDFIFQHYVGGTSDTADHWQIILRLIGEIQRWTEDGGEIRSDHDDLLRDFPIWLAKERLKAERNGVRFVLTLDGLDRVGDSDHALLLGWLPSQPFTGPLRLIVSGVAADTLDLLRKRSWESLRIEPLTEASAAR
jgi:hypothetical protein